MPVRMAFIGDEFNTYVPYCCKHVIQYCVSAVMKIKLTEDEDAAYRRSDFSSVPSLS